MTLMKFIAATLAATPLMVGAILNTAMAADLEQFSTHAQDSTDTVDNTAYAAFLDAYLKADASGINLVDYGAVTAEDRKALQGYIKSLEAIDPTTLSKDEAFAFWGNLYNAVTLEVILEDYPVKSIRDIKPNLFSVGPWDIDKVTINGEVLTLNNIEHDILRAFWEEPRVHYVVNCASIGCPNLRPEPWTADGLEAALTAAAQGYINSPRGVSVKDGKVTASSIFKWFKKDFGSSNANIIAHWKKYANPELAGQLEGVSRINGYDYDWSLNDTK